MASTTPTPDPRFTAPWRAIPEEAVLPDGTLSPYGRLIYAAAEFQRRWHGSPVTLPDHSAEGDYRDAMHRLALWTITGSPACGAFFADAPGWGLHRSDDPDAAVLVEVTA